MNEMISLTLNDKTYDSFVDGVARPLAETSAIVCSASGESIVVSDSSDMPLVGLNIYGKSNQNGTPTPDAPADIKSIGDDGDVVVTVGGNTLTLALERGLRGIKVTDKSIATYTDASGQMWCADEVDLSNGQYIKRIERVVLDGSSDEAWYTNASNFGNYRASTSAYYDKVLVTANDVVGAVMCGSYKAKSANNTYSNVEGISIGTNGAIYVYDADYNTKDISLWQKHLTSNPITVLYALKIPVEIPLTAEEIAAFKVLHTNKPMTTITNDESAYMSVKYIADPKAYIDNRVSGILAATVE